MWKFWILSAKLGTGKTYDQSGNIVNIFLKNEFCRKMGLKDKKKSLLWNYLLRQNSKWGVSKQKSQILHYLSNKVETKLQMRSIETLTLSLIILNMLLSWDKTPNEEYRNSLIVFKTTFLKLLLRQNSKWGVSKLIF